MMDVERISMRIAFGNSNLIDSRLLRIAFRVIEASRVDDLILANPDLVEDIKILSDEDPSKSNKYIEWGVKQLKLEATMGDLISTIQAFHNVQNRLEKKDINQYKTLKELEDAIKDLPESKTKEKAQVKSKGAKKLWENDTHVLFRIDTQNACIAYGKGTKWCITMKEDDNPWEQYTNRNSIFYFLIDKRPSESKNSDKYSKIAWDVQRNMNDNSVEKVEIHDALDDLITNHEIQGIPEFSKINRIVIEDAPKVPDGPNVSKRKELLKKIFAGQAKGEDMTGADLRGADLNWADLRGADLRGADMAGASMVEANLRGLDLSGANLNGANLNGANLNGANLNGANLTEANLIRAKLNEATLTEASLSEANLSGAILTGAILAGANLTEARLFYAKLNGAKLTGADLSGTDLRANLSKADLVGAILLGANLYGADLSGANLTNADLTGADLRNANLSNANLTNAKLIGAILDGAKTQGADFTGADMDPEII